MNHVAALPPNLTLDQVAERLNVSYSSASRLCSARGYKCKRKAKLSILPRAKQLINKGLSNIEIAGALDVSRERIRQIRKKLGSPKVENRGRKTGISPYRLNGKKRS